PPASGVRTGSAAAPAPEDQRPRAAAPAPHGCALPYALPAAPHRRQGSVAPWSVLWSSWRTGTTTQPQHLVSSTVLGYYMQTYPQGVRSAQPCSGARRRGCRFGTPVHGACHDDQTPRNPWSHGGVNLAPPSAEAAASSDGAGNFPPPLTRERCRTLCGTARQNPRSDGGANFAPPSPQADGGKPLAPRCGQLSAPGGRHRAARSASLFTGCCRRATGRNGAGNVQ